MDEDNGDESSISYDEDLDESTDESIIRSISRFRDPYFLSLISSIILFTVSFMSINWMSSVYLFGGCMYLAHIISEKRCIIFLIYSILVLGTKATAIALIYSTDYMDRLTDFQQDLLCSIGITFVSKNLEKIVLSLAAEGIAIIGLTVVIKLSHRINDPAKNPLARQDSGNIADRNPLGRTLIPKKNLSKKYIRSTKASHLWFWLTVVFLNLVYIFGNSACYVTMFFMLILVLVGWERSSTINSRLLHEACRFCTLFSMITFLILYAGQVDVIRWLPESVIAIAGFGKGWIGYVSLVGVFCCSALYGRQDISDGQPDTQGLLLTNTLEFEPEVEKKGKIEKRKGKKAKKKVEKEELLLEGVKSAILDDMTNYYTKGKLYPIEEDKRESYELPEPESDIQPLFDTIKYFFINIWKLVTSTPLGIMIILRAYLMIWSLRYSSLLSIILIFWNYYSICYKNISLFCKITPYLLLPTVSLQILGTKFVSIPMVVDKVIPESFKPYLPIIGCIKFTSDHGSIPELEYTIILIGLLLVCISLKMIQYIPQYDKWVKEKDEILCKKPNGIEIIIRFILEHTEKLYMVLLYIISLSTLNVINTLILLFLIFLALLKKHARKYFILIIFILAFKSIGRYAVLTGVIVGTDYGENILYIFKIVGIYAEFDKTAEIYKLGMDWQLIIMYSCTYLQLRILYYIELNPFQDIQMAPDNILLKFANFFNYIVQTYLLWAIYLTFIVILMYQNVSVFIQGYVIIVVILVTVHVSKDLNNKEYKGYLYVRPIWSILAVYNTIILFASYLTYFVVYTGEYNHGFSISEVNLIRIIGIDFTNSKSKQLQGMFLPQFIILYLGFLARVNMQAQVEKASKEIEYKRKAWMWLIYLLDGVSRYSFHIMFLIVGFLAILWSINFSMLVFLCLFGIHYSTLHSKYLNTLKFLPNSLINYQEKQRIISEETLKQKAHALSQCRLTLNFVVILSSVCLILAQLFSFVQVLEDWIDRFNSDKTIRSLINDLEIFEALGSFLGLIGKSTPKTSMLKLVIGYLIMLCMCAIETRALNWYENRMGYTYKRVFPAESLKDEKKASVFDVFKLIIFKYALASVQRIKYKMATMTILKTVLEYFFVGLFLFSVAGKNNILEMAFAPFAAICIIAKLSLKTSYYISVYMWFWFLVQILLFVFNITSQSVPQELDSTVFSRAFKLLDWPSYNVIFKGWNHKSDWGHYFGLGGTTTTRYFFVLDVCLLMFQATYFQRFCHSLYSLSTFEKEKEDPTEVFISKILVHEIERNISKTMKLSYKVVKNVLFVYSHIFTLFCLLVMTFSTRGAINVLYLGFSVIFMQFDLFGNIGTKEWTLPLFFRYVLKPYIFLDLSAQFAYQIPYLTQTFDQKIMACIGIHILSDNYFAIWIKTLIFTVILYQDAIYSSKEYQRTCKQERVKIKSLQRRKRKCMALLYNNIRIQEFRRQQNKVSRTYEELSKLSSRIDRWNEVLHRKETKAKSNLEAESGLLIDIDDSSQRLERLKKKLEEVHEYQEGALNHANLLEKLYLMLHSNVNNVIFMNEQELANLEKELNKGRYTLPNPVIEYYIKLYCERKQDKIIVEKLKLEALKLKLEIKQTGQVSQVPLADNKDKIEPKKELEKKFGKISIIFEILVMLVKFAFSSTQEICFLFMIIAEICNGSLMSLVYVLSIFCYGLISKCRPHRFYWKFIRLYSGLVIVIKYISVFIESVTELNGSVTWVNKYKNGWRIGLFDGSKRGIMFFLIFDALVLFGITFHGYILNVLGLTMRTEEDVETIPNAMERIAKSNPQEETKKTETPQIEGTTALVEEEKDEFLREESFRINDDCKPARVSEHNEPIEDEDNKEGFISKTFNLLFFDNSMGRNLFPKLKNEKPGTSFDAVLTTLQIILCVYIIFFWSNMTFDVTSLNKIKMSEFSELTVIALFIQIILILIERYIYSKRPLLSTTPTVITKTTIPSSLENLYSATYKVNNYALLLRYFFHIIQLLIIHAMVFWYFPNDAGARINGNSECTKEDILANQCNEVPNNFFLIGFYCIYCLYFWLSALQIRYSWPEVEERSLMKSSNTIGKAMIQAFYAIPFAWELQQVVSWLWINTSFDIFQWLKFEEIYGKLFTIKCTSKVRRRQLLGVKTTGFVKYAMGGGLLFLLIFLIVIPVVAFSNLNPMVELNNPTKASFLITLGYGTKMFELMEISDALIEDMSNNAEDLRSLRSFKEIRGAEFEQFRHLRFANSSDDYTFPTNAKLEDIYDYFLTLKTLPVITIKYTFNRPEPLNLQQVSLQFTRSIEDEAELKKLRQFFDPDSTVTQYKITLEKFFCKAIVLSLQGEPKALDNWKLHSISSADLTLHLSLDNVLKKENTNILAFHVESGGSDLTLFAVSEKSRTSFLAGYSIITLYVSVVLVAGRMIRGIFSGTYSSIMYEDMPNPSPLLKLCSGVEVARYENNFIEESRLYWTLIEVLRSNELMKLITKTSQEFYMFAEKKVEKPAE